MSIPNQLIDLLKAGECGQLLDSLKSPEITHHLKSDGVFDLVKVIATLFHECICLSSMETSEAVNVSHFDELAYECCRLLRNSCAVGKTVQNQIAAFELDSHTIFDAINVLLFDQSKLSPKTRKMCWQFVANLCVQNDATQRLIWSKCIAPQLPQLNCVCQTENSRECTMILYNLFLSEILSTSDVKMVVEILLQCFLDRHENTDFHQLFMEHLITKYRSIAPVYDRLMPADKRLHLIYYIGEHMKVVRHDPISTPLLQFICRDFKKKSDCVLKTATAVDTIHPHEVVALLEVIARASADERYSHVLASDSSLFINVGCLLRTVHEIGKQQSDSNIFAPVQKLNQLAPNSSDDTSIERDISYQLKSTLIRTLANLAYKHKENQDLAREMEFLVAVLDSTALDARNPLIKEWSILAIRNLCEGNAENQEIIRQLTKVGDSKSDIISEFYLDLGSLRINPN
ncbi:ataxin-10 [Sitodiplosis mosellana]|uniref:ataxin-10 n=1 Tax=Sitodiplosis mosellana TaxID=263140 RepID=UPI002444FECA|nr:ataxin-10 [Sitodiplosis mosellana]